MHVIQILATLTLTVALSNFCLAIDPYAGNDPFLILIHEPAVHAELKLNPKQQSEYQRLTDLLDARFFPLRNKSGDEASKEMTQISADAKGKLKTLLQPAQYR